MKRDYKVVYEELRTELYRQLNRNEISYEEFSKKYEILNANYDKYDALEEKNGRMSLVTKEMMLER